MKRPKLADEIRAVSQPSQPTAAQIEFERFLKCKEQRAASETIASALSKDRWDREPAAPLIAPSQLLPPMF